jgi:hypothetical protein
MSHSGFAVSPFTPGSGLRRGLLSAALLLALGLVVGACSSSSDDEAGAAPSGAGSSSNEGAADESPLQSARLACAGERALMVLADERGDALVAAAAEYTLSESERKTLAGWWLLVLSATETGVIDPALLAPALEASVIPIVERYTSLFEGCDATASALGAARQALIENEQSFT